VSVTRLGDLDALRRQIAATHARFTAIGTRLAQAAESIALTGALPSVALLRELQDAAHEFQTVYAAVQDAAAALEILLPRRVEPLPSLGDLAELMETVSRAAAQAARRRRLDGSRAAAFSVLNRVTAIVHDEDAAFAPLAACHDEARALRAGIEAADPGDVDEAAEAWARALTPFVALLELLDAPVAADDAQWAELEEMVASAFGSALAVAATRGHLAIG
jgi:hypothetical protein